MIKSITEKAFAKINLSIDIVSRMDSGYHNMRMVMQSVGLHDEIFIQCQPGEGISVVTDLKYLPGDERNIASRAPRCFSPIQGSSAGAVISTSERPSRFAPVSAAAVRTAPLSCAR